MVISSHEDKIRKCEKPMSNFIAQAPASIKTFSLARRVAHFNIPVLLMGETGSGKECVAKYIHTTAFGENSTVPFIAINCAAIPESMLESTLFGYEKGAFTGAVNTLPGKFELANNGTLLLDEIGDMPLPLQAKLLRVLQERQVERLGSHRTINLSFRLMASTNKNLESEVAAGRFREDLFYRISVVPVTVSHRERESGAVELLLARQRAAARKRHSARHGVKPERGDPRQRAGDPLQYTGGDRRLSDCRDPHSLS